MRTRGQELFEGYGIPIAFLTVTQTQLNKSIMDVVKPVKELLKESGLHNYDTQEQGTHAKVVKTVNFITLTSAVVGSNESDEALVDSTTTVEEKVTLYRPNSKDGDPRIWFTNLKKYAHAGDLLIIITNGETLYVVNTREDEVLNEISDPDNILGQVIGEVWKALLDKVNRGRW